MLALGFVAALMSNGRFTGVEERLRDLERLLQVAAGGEAGGPPPGTVVRDREEWERIPGAVELYRSALALVHDDADGAIAHAGLATARAADGDHLTRAGAAAVAGLARWAGGDLEEAHRAYRASVDGLASWTSNCSKIKSCVISSPGFHRPLWTARPSHSRL